MIKFFFLLCLFYFSGCYGNIISPEDEQTDATFASYFRWVNHLQELAIEPPATIIAAFGKPTAPIDPNALFAFRQFWNAFPDGSSLPYSETQGGLASRQQMASALEKEYNHRITVNPNHVIFTVGGCGALQAAFFAINALYPTKKLVTISPFYPQYQVLHGGASHNLLHPIDVTKTGFRLTAESLEESLLHISHSDISAFVFCDPNNPCGTTPGEQEWLNIATILKGFPNIPIILDEAYAEICFRMRHQSLLEVCPELAERIILIRSATKGLSAAGERMAMALVYDKKIRSLMLDYLTNISLHSPVSHHYAYAYAMSQLTPEQKEQLASFYEKRFLYVQEEVAKLGINLKDKAYQPCATFYLLVDLSVLKGKELHPKAAHILSKTESDPKIETDLDIAFHLLIERKIAITPLSFFGLDPKACLMRVTCSDEIEVLEELIKRLKNEINKIK